jgi:predicted nucleic acid-binding Zn ribbon protein
MLSKVMESLQEEIVSLRERTAQEIKGIDAYLSQPRAKSKLRPRIVPNKGYSSFSIIWQRLVFYNFTTRRAILKTIRKGRGYQVSKSRLLSRCRDCAEWETGYIWEKEQLFAGVRRKVALLSQGVSALKQYCSLEPPTAPEQLGSDGACMEMQEVVKTLTKAFKSLKERTRREVTKVRSRLNGVGIKPRVGDGKGSGFTVEWFRPNGSDSEAGLAVERQIPREGKYSMRRSRLLAHCRCEEREQKFIWEKELEFAKARKQVELLSQAITALKQYGKSKKEEEE